MVKNVDTYLSWWKKQNDTNKLPTVVTKPREIKIWLCCSFAGHLENVLYCIDLCFVEKCYRVKEDFKYLVLIARYWFSQQA